MEYKSVSPEWDRLGEQLALLHQRCKEIIDTQYLSEYDVEDVEFYVSECEADRTWSIALGDQWVDMITPRSDTYIDPNNKSRDMEPCEVAFGLDEPIRYFLKEYVNAKRIKSD